MSGKLLCVDHKEECLVEAGELIIRNVSKEVMTEIRELLFFHYKDDRWRGLRDEDVVFKSVGIGIMDIATGSGVLKLTRQKQKGSLSMISSGAQVFFFEKVESWVKWMSR
ncbi:hypothetical protein N7462_008214 [Penicillium macrosclerotiorum]|uniref:uncharacterized protein n=1 Tax=Penicillium macrosclerotiorum TaxID=303699 RepID=UPI002547623E|nr:uncharacterized protein N7462_008214 [Penicillium macrosclerotiorum]KAJ5679970.1 hypothetical protein N7462_008214 [Penicillium macrosclerotiorum]